MLVLCCLVAPLGRHALVVLAHDPNRGGPDWQVWQAVHLPRLAPVRALLAAAETCVEALHDAWYAPAVAVTGQPSRAVLRALGGLVGERMVFTVELVDAEAAHDGSRLQVTRDGLFGNLAAVLDARDLATPREIPGVAELALDLGDHLAGRPTSETVKAAAVAVWFGDLLREASAPRAPGVPARG